MIALIVLALLWVFVLTLAGLVLWWAWDAMGPRDEWETLARRDARRERAA